MHIITGAENGGLKSIPLNALPPEAWERIAGSGQAPAIIALYKEVAWLNRAVNLRAQALSSLPRMFYDAAGNEVEEEDLPFDVDMTDLLDTVEGHLTLHAAAYILPEVRFVLGRGKVLSLRALHPTTMKPQYDERRGLIGFKRRMKSRELDLSIDEVAHVWLPNRETETGPGDAPAMASLRAAGLLSYLDQYGIKMFEKGAINPTVLGFPDMAASDDITRAERWYERVTGGLKNAFAVLGMRSSVTIAQLGHKLNEIEQRDTTNSKREDVSTALGVPHSLVFSNAATFATAQQDALNFHDYTVVPQAGLIERRLNRQIFIPLTGYKLQFHPEELAIYQILQEPRARVLSLMYRDGVIETNEYRTGMGYEAWDEDAPIDREMQESEDRLKDDVDEDDAEVEKKRWRKMAIRRFAEGKPQKALTFRTTSIDGAEADAIRSALATASTPDEASQVFDAVWAEYP